MEKYYYVKYSLDGRSVIKSTKHTNRSSETFLEKFLDCDIFVSGFIICLFKYKIKLEAFNLQPLKITKIEFISWRFTRYPDDIKAASHQQMQRVLAFTTLNRKKALK